MFILTFVLIRMIISQENFSTRVHRQLIKLYWTTEHHRTISNLIIFPTIAWGEATTTARMRKELHFKICGGSVARNQEWVGTTLVCIFQLRTLSLFSIRTSDDNTMAKRNKVVTSKSASFLLPDEMLLFLMFIFIADRGSRDS